MRLASKAEGVGATCLLEDTCQPQPLQHTYVVQ